MSLPPPIFLAAGTAAAVAGVAACRCLLFKPERIVYPSDPRAVAAREVVVSLRDELRALLDEFARLVGAPDGQFQRVQWLRDGGRHGGGHRFTAALDSVAFNRCSLNFSTIHYPDQPEKPIVSTTAVSMIVHPRHPLAPSMHMHVSWTENRSGMAYWRVMADLNPSNPREEDKKAFSQALREAAGDVYEKAAAEGDLYFSIPALGRHRGVTHFYLEGYHTEHEDEDLALARRVGRAGLRAYSRIIRAAVKGPAATPQEQRNQLEYHTLYLFQVLTLDRGTTTGLLAQGQNDLGIMGSLPERVDGTLLESWISKVEEVQMPLIQAICGVLGTGEVLVTPDKKLRIAAALREFYKKNRDALKLQARGSVLPPPTHRPVK